MRHGTAALLAVLGIVASGVAAAAAPPSAAREAAIAVELLTMGRHDDLYARFGHAALWVHGRHAGRPVDVVYNFGFTNFSSSRLAWDFVRGRARFWVAVSTFPRTVAYYREKQRSVFRHRLRLSAAQHLQLAELLRINRLPENRTYTYHHYHDNCATRLRDLIDRVLGGKLARRWKGRALAPPQTFRQLTREGFAGRPWVLLAAESLLGRMVDRRLDSWQAAFLPRLLATNLERAGISRPAIKIVDGVEPVGDPWGGVWLLALIGGCAVILTVVAAWGMHRRRRWAGVPLLPLALLFGSSGVLLTLLFAVATLPELRFNELALLIWPTDLLLYPLLAVRMLRGRFVAGRLLRVVVFGRVIVVVLVTGAQLIGLLYQQPRLWIAVIGLPALALWLGVRRLDRAPPASLHLASGAHSE